MNTLLNTSKYFKGSHFDQGISLLCVRWYVTYKLSYRDLMEMLDGRGIKLAHQVRKEKQKRASRKQGQGVSDNPWIQLLAAWT